MKALIVGLGSIGSRHARNLKALGISDLIGVDPTAERRTQFQADLGAVAVDSLEAGLATGPTLAVIGSPNRFHLDQALVCARAGVHLLIEKPLSTSAEGTRDLIEEVRTRGLFAHVGSNWKFHPAFQTMKRLLNDGAVGKPVAAQVLAGQWLADWHPYEDYRKGYSARADLGGGVIFDSHEFDYLTWLLGPVSKIVGLSTRTGTLEISTEDVACACLLFKSGVLGTLQIDYIQRQSRRRYHVAGSEGTIEWDLRAGHVALYSARTKATTLYDTPLGDINVMYVEQLRHVLDGITNGVAPITPLKHAVAVLDLQLTLKHQAVA